ncbi:hypothetical protein [Nostoc sp.]|uniref:hypothetical protein n=1 Tax=Nostoc sp. TaxID=1180 RepID=UPI002FFCA975
MKELDKLATITCTYSRSPTGNQSTQYPIILSLPLSVFSSCGFCIAGVLRSLLRTTRSYAKPPITAIAPTKAKTRMTQATG